MLAIWSLVSLPFLKPVEHQEVHGSHIAEACLENFEHYFISVWDECNCTVVWAFFGIAFLWDWNENTFYSPVATAVFQIFWHIKCSTFTASSFRIWNNSTEIPSPPLALFVVMLPKAHLTSEMEKGMANHFSILALRIPWTVWKAARDTKGIKRLYHGEEGAGRNDSYLKRAK